MIAGWVLTLGVVGQLMGASPAPAEEVAAALTEAWAGDVACRGLEVRQAIATHDRLRLTTSEPRLTLRAVPGDRPSYCQGGGLSVFFDRGAPPGMDACVDALCRALAADGPRAARLVAALAAAPRAHEVATELALPPPPPPPATPGPLAWLVLVACAAAVLVPLGLWLTAPRRADRAPAFDRAWWLRVGALAMAGMAARGLWAATHALHSDELVYWGLTDLAADLAGPEAAMNPPLFRLLSWPLTAVSGGDPAVGRWLSVALGTLAIVAVAATARAGAGRRAGVIAAALVAVHPQLVFAGAWYRTYGVLVLASALAFLAIEVALRRDATRRDRLIAGALVGALPLAHFFGAAVALGLVVSVLLDPRRGPLRRWLPSGAMAAALAAPLAPLVLAGGATKAAVSSGLVGVEHAGRLVASALATTVGAARAPLEGSAYLDQGALYLVAIVAAAGALAMAIRLGGRARRGLSFALVASLVLPACAALWVPGVREIQLVGAIVPAALLGAYALDGLALRWAALGLAAVGAVHATVLVSEPPATARTEAAAAAAWIGSHPERQPVVGWPHALFFELGYELGLERGTIDLGVQGADQTLRLLPSCDPGGVRYVLGDSVDVTLVVGASCGGERLSDGDTHCEPTAVEGDGASGFEVFVCSARGGGGPR